MKKHFFIGGGLYFIIEIIWRILVRHKAPNILVAIVAGTACVIICWLRNKGIGKALSALIGSIYITLCELIIGLIALNCFKTRLWYYGALSFIGIISLPWSILWFIMCFIYISMVKRR